jgi:hypothetical protein
MCRKRLMLHAAAVLTTCASLLACSGSIATPPPGAPSTPAPAPPSFDGPVALLSAGQLDAAREEYRNRFRSGTMIVVLGSGTSEAMLGKALGIGVPSGNDSELAAVGARLRPDGTVSTFSLLADRQTNVLAAVADLANEEFSEAPGTFGGPIRAHAADAPDVLAWTPIDNDALRIDKGNEFVEDRWSTYRLNSISLDDDWYLLTDRVESRGSASNPIKKRTEKFELSPHGEVYDHGPTTINRVTSYRFTIGGELGPVLGEKNGLFGKISAQWTQTWTTYAVETIDYTTLNVASWVDEFDSSQQASRSNYVSDVAAIFETPKGRDPLDYSMGISFDRTNGGNSSDQRSYRANTPMFSIAPQVLPIRPDSDAWIVVRSGVTDPAGNIYKLLRFTTEGSQIPKWMALERGGANETCSFLVHANPDAKPGDIGVLQFDSVPPYATRSLERGPQSAVIEVVPKETAPSPTPSSNPKPCGT